VLQNDWCVAVYYIHCALQCNEKETSPLDYRVSVLHGVLQNDWCVAVYVVCCSVFGVLQCIRCVAVYGVLQCIWRVAV